MDRLAATFQLLATWALLVVLGAVVLAACGLPGDDPNSVSSVPQGLDGLPTIDVHADDFQQYATVEELVEASDVVVEGSVVDVSDGTFEAAPELEDFGGEQQVEIALNVEGVVHGAGVSPGETVTLEWSGYKVDESGNPTEVYVVNGVPFPVVGSEEVWFLIHDEEHGWVLADIDDGRFARSGRSLRALAETAGPAAKEVEQLGVSGLRQLVAEGLDADSVFENGDTEIAAAEGPGWRLLGSERGKAIGDHLASIVTSERGLERAWELGQFDTLPPEVSFAEEVLIILTPGVSGSCPDITFEELVIQDDPVFGAFDYPREGSGVCTSDFNAVTFFFTVDRHALPEEFTLMVSREFDSCEACSIQVDLANETAIEAELWGEGTLALATAGTPPPENAFNVVQWITADQVGALLFSDSEWSEFPTWFQSFHPEFDVERIDGFVASCTEEQCEECEGETCHDLPRMGAVCTRTYKPTPYQDQTFVVTFDGTSCTIDVEPGILGREP